MMENISVNSSETDDVRIKDPHCNPTSDELSTNEKDNASGEKSVSFQR